MWKKKMFMIALFAYMWTGTPWGDKAGLAYANINQAVAAVTLDTNQRSELEEKADLMRREAIESHIKEMKLFLKTLQLKGAKYIKVGNLALDAIERVNLQSIDGAMSRANSLLADFPNMDSAMKTVVVDAVDKLTKLRTEYVVATEHLRKIFNDGTLTKKDIDAYLHIIKIVFGYTITI